VRHGCAALSAIATQAPDLLILDVQMPELDGFDLARALGDRRLPAVLFVTAHDEYALRAFEIHALDYVLKPFSADRFRSALTHALDHLGDRRATTLGRQMPALLPRCAGRARLATARGQRTGASTSHRRAIDWCEAAATVRLHVARQTHLVRRRCMTSRPG
jgi:two-component system LytT family response regulator